MYSIIMGIQDISNKMSTLIELRIICFAGLHEEKTAPRNLKKNLAFGMESQVIKVGLSQVRLVKIKILKGMTMFTSTRRNIVTFFNCYDPAGP